MSTTKKKRKDGISLKTINALLIILALVITGLVFFSTYKLFLSFSNMTETSEQQILMRKAARELMDASDYLTENVQRFTVHGDMTFLNNYFEEAFEANHREDAISRMSMGEGSAAALEKLQAAMEDSMKLMEREYYAMRLVIEAKGYKEYPDILKSVELSEADIALSPEAKMSRANEMVLDEEYYRQKENIRIDMRASLDELENMAYATDKTAIDSFHKDLVFVRIVILFQGIGILFLVWLTSRLGINPVLNAVDRIKENTQIPEVGANEFRYLARAYNKMYNVYKSSLENLNFKVSHDALTGVYNRSGYDLIVSTLDLESTYMLLFDLDDFKGINDTYGHEIGNKVLIKLAQSLKNNFRSDDYVCRIGGDEFVVFMVHSAEMQDDLISAKIENISKELRRTRDGLPSASISVGIVHGSDATDVENLFEKSDEAMYQSKKSGKNTYTFHSDKYLTTKK
ncbi:MAG: diguanylate cyclase [Clostridiales bacterium]|nr:diguanylate cyclase [Clostridiales bacterium]